MLPPGTNPPCPPYTDERILEQEPFDPLAQLCAFFDDMTRIKPFSQDKIRKPSYPVAKVWTDLVESGEARALRLVRDVEDSAHSVDRTSSRFFPAQSTIARFGPALAPHAFVILLHG